MVKKLSLLLTFLALFTWAAWAQTSSSSQEGQSGTNSSTNRGYQGNTTGSNAGSMGQSQPGMGANSGSMNEPGAAQNGQTIKEGCIVQEETDYYLQPANGQRIKLGNSPDVSGNVGHHVRVHGSMQNGTSSASANGNAGAQSPRRGNSANAPQMLVTRVDSIAETCPYTPKHGSGMSGKSGMGGSGMDHGMSGSSGMGQGSTNPNSGTSNQNPR